MSSKHLSSLEWIDYTKAFACFLVVLGHLLMSLRSICDNDIIDYFVYFIYLFHMPLFMCLSGMLYFELQEKFSITNYKDFEIKKIINLVIPYLTFYILFMSLNTFFSKNVNNALGMKGWIGIINDPISPYWYLYALLSIFIVVPILNKIFNNRKNIVFSILLILSIINIFIKTNIYFVDSIMEWGIYFYLGNFISRKAKSKTNIKINDLIYIIIYFIFSILLYKYSYLMNNKITELIEIIFAITGTLICIDIFKKVKSSKILDTYKNYTFQIFLLHTIFAAGIRIFLLKIGIDNYILHFIIGLIVSIYIPVLVSIISKKIRYTEFFFYPVKAIKEFRGE